MWFCTHCVWHTNADSPMYGLSLLFTQRGLSPTKDMAASSPTVPVHRKVGVKEGDVQRHIENEMGGRGGRREGEKRRKRERGQRHSERRRRCYDSQRRCLPFLCVTPKPWNKPIVDDCNWLNLISPTGRAFPTHTVKQRLNALNLPVIQYIVMWTMQTVDNCFAAVEDQWQVHIPTVKTVTTSQHYNTSSPLHIVNNNHTSSDTLMPAEL